MERCVYCIQAIRHQRDYSRKCKTSSPRRAMSAREAVVTMVAVWSMFTKLVARLEATDAYHRDKDEVATIPASSNYIKGREELETTSMDARTQLQPAVVTPKQALSIKPFGLDMEVLLTTEATGGATSVIVAWHKPGEGPPDHVHFKQEEILFIIEGLYEVTVGDETAKTGPGSIVFI